MNRFIDSYSANQEKIGWFITGCLLTTSLFVLFQGKLLESIMSLTLMMINILVHDHT